MGESSSLLDHKEFGKEEKALLDVVVTAEDQRGDAKKGGKDSGSFLA